MSADEWLDKLGSEYRIQMEKDRQTFFIDTIVKLCEVFKCTGIVNSLNEEFPMIKFLEAFYDAGFYKGLAYGIESAEKHVVEDSDIAIKYGQEIADEINQDLLEKTM